MLGDSKTSGERKDEEERADGETMAAELKEENEDEAEIVDQESGERTKELISVLKEIVDIWASGEQSFYTGLKKVDIKKLNEWVRKINDIIGDIRPDSITDINDLMNAISIFVSLEVRFEGQR